MTCISCCLFHPKSCSAEPYQRSDHCVAQSSHKLPFMYSYNSSIDSSCVLRMTVSSPDSSRTKMWREKQQNRLSITSRLLRNDQSSLCSITFITCFLHACRKGYEVASKEFDPRDLDVSVVGRSFMITGANSGIGKATAVAIAKKGTRRRVVLSVKHHHMMIANITWCFVSRWHGPHGL